MEYGINPTTTKVVKNKIAIFLFFFSNKIVGYLTNINFVNQYLDLCITMK